MLEGEGSVEATEIAHRSGGEIDLVVLDVIMPGMGGIFTADELAKAISDLRTLYISGFIEGELPERHDSPSVLDRSPPASYRGARKGTVSPWATIHSS